MLSKAKIQFLKRLQLKKFRNSEDLFVAEGLKIVNEALKYYPGRVTEVYCTMQHFGHLENSGNLKPEILSSEQMAKISTLKTPPEVLAVIKIPGSLENNIAGTRKDLVLALDSVRDPGNMGTIIRLADWFGIDEVFCSADCVDCYNPKVVQATMGAIFRVNVHYVELSNFLGSVLKDKHRIYGATLDGEDIYNSKIEFPAVLVMGNESDGISQEILKKINRKLFIPRFGSNEISSESLNVSAATSVLLSEIRRQQRYSK